MRPLPPLPQVRGVFVTGTDTNVGKTWVAGGLTAALRRQGRRAVYFKPVQSGCPEKAGELIPTDARLVQRLAGLQESLAELTPIPLHLPLAPAVAARQAGVTIDLEVIAAGFRNLGPANDFLVVEGAGGLYVPLLNNDFLVLDLARWFGLPLVVVAKAGLGTINHTVLTVKAAEHAGLIVAGVLLNRYPGKPGLAEQTNPEIITALTGVPILGLLPEIPDLEGSAGREKFLAALNPVAAGLWAGAGNNG